MASWLSDASANRHIKTYVKDFLDLSGNLTVRSNEDYKWNAYGQVLSGNYEDSGVFFGISTDMDASGTTIVVGASNDSIQATNSGAVYVYRYDTTAKIWYQLGNTITESTESNTGRLVQISDNGNRVAYSTDATNEVYIYDYNSNTNTWVSAGYIQISFGHFPDGGFELSGDGNTFIVGDHIDGTYGAGTGTVVVYRNTSGTTWTKIGQLSSDNLGLVNSHTWALAISYNGNRIILGAPYYDDADGNTDSGLFWVLDYTGDGTTSTDNSDWSQVGSTIYGSPSARLGVGGEMSSDGSIIVVIADNVNPAAYVYQYDATVSGSWKLLGTPIRISYVLRGACLSYDGTTLLANDYNDDTAGTDSGALYIYKYIDNDWVQQGSTIYGSYTSSTLGQLYDSAIAINADGTKVVAGGYTADVNGTDSGYVQAFQWSQKAPYTNPMLDISGGTMAVWGSAEDTVANYSVTNVTTFEDGTDNYGANMKFNADGTIMVVGEWGYNSNAGRIHAYKYRSGTWSKMGSDAVDSNIIEIGFSLGINDSGFIIGSGGGGTSGGVIIWEFINGDWSVKGGEISNSNFSYFGHRGVSFNGEGNIVACKGNEGAAVYQYNSVNDNWDQLGSDITGITTNGGKDEISLNQAGNIVAITDPGYDSPATDAGRVGIFQYNSGSWDQLGDWITAPSTSGGTGDHYGTTVSLSSDGYIVAFGTAIGSGATTDYHARIFQYVPSVEQWTPRSPDVQNDDVITVAGSGNKVGSNVALSGDGNTLVVNDNDAQTASGVYGGAVHVLKYINGVYKWVTRLDGPTGSGNVNLSGDSVAISRDGTRFGGSRGSNDYVRIGTIVNSPDFKIEDRNMTISGNVGIGTDNPVNNLHIYKVGSSVIRMNNSVSTAGLILQQSTNKYTYIRNTESIGGIIFHAGNGERMRIMPDGKVSIHPTGVNPSFQLDVFGSILAYHTIYGNAGVQLAGRLYKNNGTTDYNPWTGYTTARFQEAIIARNFFAYSDSRIKTNIQEVNDSSALDKLRLLKPSLYNYIDILARGENQVYGFIAQEVKEVLPDAVLQYADFVPNIFSLGTYDATTNIITIENEDYDSASLSMDASNNLYKNARIYDASDNIIEICIEEIVGSKQLRIKEDPEIEISSTIFIYGQEVEDFHKLNKDAIFTVATSALQEVDRQQQADKARIATLETENATLKTQMADVLSRLAALESA